MNMRRTVTYMFAFEIPMISEKLSNKIRPDAIKTTNHYYRKP